MSTLDVRTGNKPGACLRIKHDGRELLDKDHSGSVWSGTVEDWTRAAVCASAGDRARFWRLEPGDPQTPEAEILFDGFVVRGRFRVTEKINNARRAAESFRAFEKIR